MPINALSGRVDSTDLSSSSELTNSSAVCGAPPPPTPEPGTAEAPAPPATSDAATQSLSNQFAPAQTWQNLPVDSSAPPTFDGCGKYQDCADLDGRSVREGQSASDAAASLTLTARRFAPFVTFGIKFQGDATSRHIPDQGQGGFTTDPHATARTITTAQVSDGVLSQVLGRADPSHHPMLGEARADVRVTSTSTATSATDGLINAKSAGSNPLVSFAPDIDTDEQVAYELSPGKLTLDGSVWGDRFPNAEIFATDQTGASLMLGEFQTEHGALSGPFFDLEGDAARVARFELSNFHAEIPLDPSGNFAGSPLVEKK